MLLVMALLLFAGCSEEITLDDGVDGIPKDETENDVDHEDDPAGAEGKTTETDKEGFDETEKKAEDEPKVIMFHNGRGPMCVKQLEFLENTDMCLKLEDHLVDTKEGRSLLQEMKKNHVSSRGVSSSFGYLPITFVNGNAYSGFDDEVRQMIEEDIASVCP